MVRPISSTTPNPSPAVVCAGEVMVEMSPAAGNLYQRAFAGDSFNTAVYLARAGFQVRYLTRLGDDAGSAGALRLMADEDIDSSLIQQEEGSNIGLYLIENDANGERTFIYYRDASPARRLFDHPLTLTADVFYCTGITLAVTRSGRANLLALLADLKAGGCQIVFDPNYRPRLWVDLEEARNACADVLPFCDKVLPTLSDDRALWGLESISESTEFYRDHGVAEVVVKGEGLTVEACGAAGRAKRVAQPTAAVDTTGAGDAFNAAYLASRLSGADLDQSLANAQALAAEVVRHHGAIVPLNEAAAERRGEY